MQPFLRFPFFKSIHDKFDKTLESSIKLEGFDGRNYTLIKSAMFQSEYTDYIPEEYLLDGFDATPDNPYRKKRLNESVEAGGSRRPS